jgi:hypothetical protein
MPNGSAMWTATREVAVGGNLSVEELYTVFNTFDKPIIYQYLLLVMIE